MAFRTKVVNGVLELLHLDGRPRPLTAQQLRQFTMYLALMTRAGMQIVGALHVLAAANEPYLRLTSRKVLVDVEAGMKLSDALRRQFGSFPENYTRVIATGEMTGQIDGVLSRLSANLERQGTTMSRLYNSLVYPAFLVASSLAMVFIMLYCVFPMVLKVTSDAGVRQPALTQALVNITSPKVLVGILVTLVISSLVSWKVWTSPRWGPPVRKFVEQYTPMGRFFVRVQLLRSLRELGLMLETGVDLLKALAFAGRLGEDSLLVKIAYVDCYKRVRSGEYLSVCFAHHRRVFGKTLPSMVAVAEQSGDLHTMIGRYSDLLEENVNNEIDTFTTILEPALLGMMGFGVGIILIAAFLPIYSLVQL